MRLFLDSNIATYIALFEGFLIEGESELPQDVAFWTYIQGTPPDENVMREVRALRSLYTIDERARFEFLISDISLQEIAKIRQGRKRAHHFDLIRRLLEHRDMIYLHDQHRDIATLRDTKFAEWRPLLPQKMTNDGLLFAEAEIVESSYFLTNDGQFINRSKTLDASVIACRPSDLIHSLLPQGDGYPIC